MAKSKPKLFEQKLIDQQIANAKALTGPERREALESVLADLRDGMSDYGQRAERNEGTAAGEAYKVQVAGYRAALAHVEKAFEQWPN